MKRRNFIFDIFSIGLMSSLTTRLKAKTFNITPMVRSISTWKTTEANLKAGVMLDQGIDGLTAAVAGVAIEEENPKNTTVGFGGAPDRTGSVTLDACVMNHLGDCGSVVAVENIVNVAKLARDVMEKTPHVMLAGKGAEEFGVSEGVSGFVFPLGATMNMDGTALFEGIAAVFLAHLYGIDLSPVATFSIFFM